MKIFRSIDEIREPLPSPVVTIGNFDGVHLGHREIFRRVKREAARLDGVSMVITFTPHPLKVLGLRKELRLINTYAEKELLIEASGIDCLLTIPFTAEFAAIGAERFVGEILVGRIGVKKLVIGYDYAFGRNREGDVAMLRRMGEEHGFEVEVLEQIASGETVYSSSAVRRMIAAGNVREVVSLIGRHYSVGGTVVHGRRRGKDLGFPTANLRTEKELIPAAGVYAVKVRVDDTIRDGACNIGNNPTFGNEEVTVEVHILDFDGDLYGKEIRVYFVDRVREELRYPDLNALKEGISRDVARCRELLAGVSIIEYRDYLGGDAA
ncbi:bifunctional riboflavin kinase/FAD synthetase [Geobacter sulfurreducens]|jgi:riboflavin kinase/FMN adenylyltransferase|uniref:Riboflavin biosynthesis protein n=1 Tax=Geobacter sulfurreducens (strain ATCC 51573 / DSM 12127 / PCA) TaxID=243231 RepID=Q74D32_GEOSL|nr:bifunctional riboflavin kinase/FAD synthetase [Geobacter sulfurreducens]AAR34861.1 riboflavin kinase and FAD synthetase [Geobacter sulfurreducens PCA]ADI84326.1 riboflavin kinase and FAD synthetase [Geobacter sulfurreducens KN400]QVW36663.1 bifunctional riboflavin kinase/FAD synthetase [Geobacter sulfurreducens]UAC05499.1 bifunctional riboflavin kinase/FAD synthetase [Geobacter sulfurreducens]UTG94130.1 bifunctional riboflavin kinase/FAD synthetase [Geobacter sulfurreducens]